MNHDRLLLGSFIVYSTSFWPLLHVGTEITSSFLEWCPLYYIVKFPTVQDRVFSEIKDKVGLDRPVNLRDQDQLPYAMAVLEEIQRHNEIKFPSMTSFSKW